MTTPTSRILLELADREAIRECMYRYARGIDRMDAEQVRASYWPDCIDRHGEFEGDTEQFIAWAFGDLAKMDQTQHFMNNMLIAVHGDTADAETYFYAYQRMNRRNGEKIDLIAAGRYLDNFEKRDDEWRIAKRKVEIDWYRYFPDSADWERGMAGMKVPPGGRYQEDDSYSLLNLR